MKLSICIVNWNVKDLLKKCISSIYMHPPYCDFEIIVADNASNDGSVQMIKSQFSDVKIIENKSNAGFASGNNQAIKASYGDLILILNPDTEILQNSINTLIDFINSGKDIGIAAPKLLNPDRSLQKSCLSFPTLSAMAMRQLFLEFLWPNNPATKAYLMSDFKYDKITEVDQPMGACFLIKKEVLDQVGFFDESSFMFFDEVDLCYRIKHYKRNNVVGAHHDAPIGWKIYFVPDAKIIHYGGSSIKKWGAFNLSRHWTRSRNLFFKKNYGQAAILALYFFDFLRILIILVLLFGVYNIIRYMNRLR